MGGTVRAPGAGAATRGRLALLLIGIMLIGANLRAGITSVGPVLGDLTAATSMGPTAAGLLVSLPVLAFAVFSSMAPPLALRFGLERTLWTSLLVLAAAIVLRSVPAPGAIWVGTAAMGAAIAFLNVLLPSIVKREFPTRVSTVTGAYSIMQAMTAAFASGLAVPIAGVSQNGWRLSIGVWAGVALLAAAVFTPQLVRAGARRRALAEARAGADAGPAPAAPGRPEGGGGRAESGAGPDGDGRAVRGPAAASGGRRGLPWGSALAWQVTLFLGLQSFLFYVLISWLPSIEQDLGVAAAAAGWHLFFYQVVSMLAMTVTPWAIHRLPSQTLVGAIGSLCGLAGILGLLLVPALLLLWVALLGVGGGSMILLALSLFGLRTRHHERTAALSGMAQTVGYLLAAVGPFLMGLLHGVSGGWTIPLVVLAAVLVLQTVFAALAGRDRVVD